MRRIRFAVGVVLVMLAGDLVVAEEVATLPVDRGGTVLRTEGVKADAVKVK